MDALHMDALHMDAVVNGVNHTFRCDSHVIFEMSSTYFEEVNHSELL